MSHRSELTLATLDERIVEMRTQGFNQTQIAKALGLETRDVAARIRFQAERIRAAVRGLTAVRFLQQDTTLQVVIAGLKRRILTARTWDKDDLRTLCSLLERQARLLGLDIANTARDNDSYLDTKSPEELRQIAATYGIQVPETLFHARECDNREVGAGGG